MNNKKVKNINISMIESQKQTQQMRRMRQNHGYRVCFDGCQMGGGYRGIGEEVRGLRSTNR